ncbi:MAG TPA: ribonucleotide reductase N-terminal alpha domain-containing protein, partial [Nitrospiraceae bacterium]|nr:ribonucleotide reductase N-terminal alpha domain-containing protein [Nitrospiraceae bacterium]
MVVGQWVFILTNWTLKMQAAPFTPAQSVNQLLSVYNSTMAVKKMTASSCPPKRPRLHLSAHANVILRGRYLAKNAAGTIVETPAQLFWRVATDIARAGRLYPTAGRLP